MRRFFVMFSVFSVAIFGVSRSSSAQTLYVLEGGQIVVADTQLSPPTTVVTGISQGRMLAVDPDAGFIFWMAGVQVQRAATDGSAVTPLFMHPGSQPAWMSVDAMAQRVYWIDPGIQEILAIDYAGVSTVSANGFSFLTGLVLDPPSNQVFYCLGGPGIVVADNFGLGSGQAIATGVPGARAVTYDPVSQTVFWVGSTGLLASTPSVGGSVAFLSSVAASGAEVRRMIIDPTVGKLYVATSSTITRYELDGTFPEVVYSGAGISDFALTAETTIIETEFQRGDCNNDGGFNIADMIFLLGSLFIAGDPGTCEDACDTNDDGGRNIADAINGLNILFGGGGAVLPPPFGACGLDPTTADPFDCAANPGCP